MAKKKRRGRPPGSKNKTKVTKGFGKSVATMDVAELRSHIDTLQNLLSKKVSEQRSYFESQIAQLGGFVSKKASTAYKTVTHGNGKAGKRAKPAAKYQSKKDKSVKWSGRGMTPNWMKAEMKGTKLTKEDFAIS